MFGKFINLLALLVTFAWTALIGTLAVPSFLINERLGHFFHRLWGIGCLKIMGVHVTYLGMEKLPRKSALLAPNHESVFDILLACSLPVNFKWVSKQENAKLPFAGWTMSAMGTFWVRRDRSGHDVSVMKSVEVCQRSEPVLPFIAWIRYVSAVVRTGITIVFAPVAIGEP